MKRTAFLGALGTSLALAVISTSLQNKLNRSDESLTQAIARVKIIPNSEAAWVNLAKKQRDDGNRVQSKQALRVATHLARNRSQLLREILIEYLRQNLYIDSIPTAQRLMEIDSRSSLDLFEQYTRLFGEKKFVQSLLPRSEIKNGLKKRVSALSYLFIKAPQRHGARIYESLLRVWKFLSEEEKQEFLSSYSGLQFYRQLKKSPDRFSWIREFASSSQSATKISKPGIVKLPLKSEDPRNPFCWKFWHIHVEEADDRAVQYSRRLAEHSSVYGQARCFVPIEVNSKSLIVVRGGWHTGIEHWQKHPLMNLRLFSSSDIEGSNKKSIIASYSGKSGETEFEHAFEASNSTLGLEITYRPPMWKDEPPTTPLDFWFKSPSVTVIPNEKKKWPHS